MNKYEALYILNASLDDAAKDALIERFKSVVEGEGGSVESVDKWGSQKTRLRNCFQERRLLRSDDFRGEAGNSRRARTSDAHYRRRNEIHRRKEVGETMNKCIFIGNLTRDPEHQTTGSGVSFCRFSIAVNRSYTNASGEREADFINIVTWRGLADNCAKYLSKGRKVCVVGSLQTRSYDDKDGNKRYATEIVAEDVEFINAGGSGGDNSSSDSAPARSGGNKKVSELQPVDTDDLPF